MTTQACDRDRGRLGRPLRTLAAGGLAAGALAAGAVVAGAQAASAHAVLVSTSPADGASLRQPPRVVSLRFDEAVGTPAYVTVTGPGGRAEQGSAKVDGALVSVALDGATAPGRYAVAYRVSSDDGHPVEGRFSYQVTSAATPTSSPGSGPGSSPGSSPGAPAAAAAVTAPAAGDDTGHGSHWFAGLAGGAAVLAGVGALIWERLRRGDADGDPGSQGPT
jgi:methionine-rich copper-binding protein CopC